MADEKTWDFDPKADDYDRQVARAQGENAIPNVHARYDDVLDAVVARAEISPGERVLDLGTGTGALALRFLQRGAFVVGLDPSESMLDKARAKVGLDHRIRLVHAEEPFSEILYPSASFDVVASSYAFHHVAHAKKPGSLAEMLRVLKPGGRWVLGDLCFRNEREEADALERFAWLEGEYFCRIDLLSSAFSALGCALQAEQFTPVTWVLWTQKPVVKEQAET